jgi:hypothetical protein
MANAFTQLSLGEHGSCFELWLAGTPSENRRFARGPQAA